MILRWIQSDIFLITAARISKDIRYDLFYTYFSKCASGDLEVDQLQSKKHFKVSEMQASIDMLQEELKFAVPMRVKHMVMTLASFACMFQISWSLMLVDLLAIVLVAVTKLAQNVCLRRTKIRADGQKDSLTSVSARSFVRDADKFNLNAAEYHKLNEQLFSTEYRGSLLFTVGRVLNQIAFIIARVMAIGFAWNGYRNATNEEGEHWLKVNITIEEIFVFFTFNVVLILNVGGLASSKFSEHKAAMTTAQARIFTAIKLEPVRVKPEEKAVVAVRFEVQDDRSEEHRLARSQRSHAADTNLFQTAFSETGKTS